MTTLHILALSGSLRRASTNTALLQAAAELAPEGLTLRIHDYAALPLFNGDLEIPASVTDLKTAITEADAVLISVPEYNYSLPGVLKNAIDWASRPAYHSPFRDKPVGLISAAASIVGGARAQQHTKQILLGMIAPVFPWPELLVGAAHTKFSDGVLSDVPTREALERYMAGFAAWVSKQKLEPRNTPETGA